MRLKDYLWASGMTQKQFGKKIRYSGAYIGHVINGVFKPGPKFIEDVEKATNGLVQAHELRCEFGWMTKKEEKEKENENFEQMTFDDVKKRA